ncbi:hypothetical protein HK099_002837 [Clydaea vesicula]|uniref:Uncharacterized protein n=1 Tax=Clydaea vesicula TaxID=447962 RepID=A0AAD5U2L1_9FUNG|nr:hypothetical protein HK099_002837 [Clydaea vesicula]
MQFCKANSTNLYIVNDYNDSEKYAIVIPFTEDQEHLIFKNLKVNWLSNKPCNYLENGHEINFPSKNKFDIIFYYNKDLKKKSNLMFNLKLIFKHNSHLKNCFNKIKFFDSNLSIEEDRYPLGASRMFFKLYNEKSNDFVKNGYSKFFLMEPDNIPCRKNWLEKLLSEFRTNQFWMRGSIIRNSNSLNGLSSFADHINGNSFYNIGDERFVKLVNRLEELFWLDSNLYLDSYDIALFMLRKERELFSFNEFAETVHMFQYTNTIQNWYRTHINATELCLKEKDTFFVHGRNVVI